MGGGNPYTSFYKDVTEGKDLSQMVELSTDKPRVIAGTNMDADYLAMEEDNYTMLGYSEFNSTPAVDPNDAIIQGVKVHASAMVVYERQFTETKSGSTAIVLPSKSPTTAQTINIPYNIDRFDYDVTYWAKLKNRPVFGVRWRNLTPEERSQIGSNKGVLIQMVRKGSPAFQADILEGDIVRKVAEQEVIDIADASDKMGQFAGRTVVVEVLRGNTTKLVQVALNPKS
jgi:hypothetical protein